MAFPGKIYQGRVTKVADAPITIRTGRRAKTIVPVTITVDAPGGKLRPGMNAEAAISLQR